MTSNDSENKGYKSYLEEDGGRKGIFKWILSTDHKRIGLLYLYSIMGWFCVGVVLRPGSFDELLRTPNWADTLSPPVIAPLR